MARFNDMSDEERNEFGSQVVDNIYENTLRYMCGIYCGTCEESDLIGTGFYLSCGGRHFCITAKHVVEGKSPGQVLSMSTSGESRPVFMPATVKLSKSPSDFAVIQIPENIRTHMRDKAFLSEEQIDVSEVLEDDGYVLSGFPEVLRIKQPSKIQTTPMYFGTKKGNELPKHGAIPYSRSSNFPFECPRTGNKYTRGGAFRMQDLAGMSGGPIYKMGIPADDVSNWSFARVRVISLLGAVNDLEEQKRQVTGLGASYDDMNHPVAVGTKMSEVMRFIHQRCL